MTSCFQAWGAKVTEDFDNDRDATQWHYSHFRAPLDISRHPIRTPPGSPCHLLDRGSARTPWLECHTCSTTRDFLISFKLHQSWQLQLQTPQDSRCMQATSYLCLQCGPNLPAAAALPWTSHLPSWRWERAASPWPGVPSAAHKLWEHNTKFLNHYSVALAGLPGKTQSNNLTSCHCENTVVLHNSASCPDVQKTMTT